MNKLNCANKNIWIKLLAVCPCEVFYKRNRGAIYSIILQSYIIHFIGVKLSEGWNCKN